MLDDHLIEIISDVFGVPRDEITAATGPETLVDWDSVAHLKLILQIEEEFGVRFPAGNIPKLLSAGQIQDALNRLRLAG